METALKNLITSAASLSSFFFCFSLLFYIYAFDRHVYPSSIASVHALPGNQTSVFVELHCWSYMNERLPVFYMISMQWIALNIVEIVWFSRPSGFIFRCITLQIWVGQISSLALGILIAFVTQWLQDYRSPPPHFYPAKRRHSIMYRNVWLSFNCLWYC